MMIDRPTIAGRAETARALARAIDDLRRGVDLPVQDLAAALARRILALGSGLDRPAAPAARADLRRAEIRADGAIATEARAEIRADDAIRSAREARGAGTLAYVLLGIDPTAADLAATQAEAQCATDLAADLRDARTLDRRLAPIAGRRARVADRTLRDVARAAGPDYARDVVRAIPCLPDTVVGATGEQADRRRATVRAVVTGARWARQHLAAPIGGQATRDYHGRVSESAPADPRIVPLRRAPHVADLRLRPGPVDRPEVHPALPDPDQFAPPATQWARVAILAILRGDGAGDCRLAAEVSAAPRLWAGIVRAAIVEPTDGIRWISHVRAACTHSPARWAWGAAAAARLAWAIADDLRAGDRAEVRASIARVDLAIGESIASRTTGPRVAPRGPDLESIERTPPRDPSVVAGRTIPAVRPHAPQRAYRGPRSTYLPADFRVRARRPAWSVAGLVHEPELIRTAPAAEEPGIAPHAADSGPRRGKRSTPAVLRRQAVPVATGD